MSRSHQPNPFVCAFLFGLAGSGLGAFAGALIAGQTWKNMSVAEQAVRRSYSMMVDGLVKGSFVGVLVGAVAGVLYACLLRSKKAEPSTAPGGDRVS